MLQVSIPLSKQPGSNPSHLLSSWASVSPPSKGTSDRVLRKHLERSLAHGDTQGQDNRVMLQWQVPLLTVKILPEKRG